jgi:hypothetical protein
VRAFDRSGMTLHRWDVPAWVPLVEEMEQHRRANPEKVLADGGFYGNDSDAVVAS